MDCESLFYARRNTGIQLLLMHTSVTSVPYREIRDMIVFDNTQHIGTIVPMYYTSGEPSCKWICKRCKKALC